MVDSETQTDITGSIAAIDDSDASGSYYDDNVSQASGASQVSRASAASVANRKELKPPVLVKADSAVETSNTLLPPGFKKERRGSAVGNKC